MKDALKSFAAITSAILICLILAWFYLRGRALSEDIKVPLAHPFLQIFQSGQPVLIAHRGGWAERPENTLLAFKHAASLSPNLVLWADIRPTKDGTLVAFRDRDLASTTEGQGWIAYEPDSVVLKLDPTSKFKDASGANPYRGQGERIPKLEELLAALPDSRFILNFRDHRPGLDDKIIAIIDQAKAGDRVLITSPEDGILRDLREKKPMWIFGTSQAQGTRMKMMDSLGLQVVSGLRGDVFVFEPQSIRAELFDLSPSIIDEVHRRKMKVITGPAESDEDATRLAAAGVDGILVAKPSAHLSTSTSAHPSKGADTGSK